MEKAVIVSAVRTPLGSFGGALKEVGATDLGAHVIKEAVDRAGIEKAEVNECIMGMVLPCGYGQNPAKQAAIKADLPQEVEAVTVNKVCGSALKAVMMAAQAIQCGDADVIIAGGMESMSSAPYYLPKARWGHRMGSGEIMDHLIHDGLWDVVNDFHMGMSNELICQKWQITREAQDRFAEESYRRGAQAQENGLFADEISPIEIPERKGQNRLFATDECLSLTSYETLQKMRPSFEDNGVTTAGNASALADGAAAVVVMGRQKAEARGCTILAEIGAQASAGIELKHVIMSPVLAIPKVLKKEDISPEDIDLFEINEAFSGTSVAINKALALESSKVNVNGGSVALGHPIGASGCRLLVTLLYEMKRRNVRRGLVSLCVGGGEGVALIVNR